MVFKNQFEGSIAFKFFFLFSFS